VVAGPSEVHVSLRGGSQLGGTPRSSSHGLSPRSRELGGAMVQTTAPTSSRRRVAVLGPAAAFEFKVRLPHLFLQRPVLAALFTFGWSGVGELLDLFNSCVTSRTLVDVDRHDDTLPSIRHAIAPFLIGVKTLLRAWWNGRHGGFPST